MNRKAQANIGNFFIVLIVGAILAIVGVLIFSKVNNTTADLFPTDLKHIYNETLGTISVTDAETGDNSTMISKTGYILNSETVRNNSGAGIALVRNVDYKITLVGGSSGELDVQANFTLLNNSGSATGESGFNNTPLTISYNRNIKGIGRLASENMSTTILDSFELGVVAYIVLAAAVILGAIFLFARNK